MIAPFFISSGRSKVDLLSAVTPETTTTQVNTQVASTETAQATPAATPKENLAVAPSDQSEASDQSEVSDLSDTAPVEQVGEQVSEQVDEQGKVETTTATVSNTQIQGE